MGFGLTTHFIEGYLMPDDVESAGGKDATAQATAKVKQRKTYLTMRIKELQAELKAHQAERQDIVEKLKAVTDQKAPETIAMKDRRTYLAHRPNDLRAELAALQAQRRELSPPKPAPAEQ